MTQACDEPGMRFAIMKEVPMSQIGIRQWGEMARYIRKFVYKPVGTHRMPYRCAKTKEDFARWLYEECGYGKFYVQKFWGDKYGPDKLFMRRTYIAIVNINQSGHDDILPEFINLKRISKYRWFCPKEKNTKLPAYQTGKSAHSDTHAFDVSAPEKGDSDSGDDNDDTE